MNHEQNNEGIIIAIGFSIAALIVNALITYFSIYEYWIVSPMVAIATTCLICVEGRKLRLIPMSVLCIAFIATNNISVQLLANPSGYGFQEVLNSLWYGFDDEWYSVWFLAAILLSNCVLAITVAKRKNAKDTEKFVAVTLFFMTFVLFIAHEHVFKILFNRENY